MKMSDIKIRKAFKKGTLSRDEAVKLLLEDKRYTLQDAVNTVKLWERQ